MFLKVMCMRTINYNDVSTKHSFIQKQMLTFNSNVYAYVYALNRYSQAYNHLNLKYTITHHTLHMCLILL